MPSYTHTKRVRALVLLALAGVVAMTLASLASRWSGGWPGRRAEPHTAQVAPLAEEVDQQTQAFSLSKTEGDHTLYTIQAEQVTNYKDTQKAVLHGVTIQIFGQDGSRHDRITTPECEYDPVAGALWVPGEVEMHFDLPAGRVAESSGQRVLIRTSQLRFEQATGIASTDAEVRFQFPQGDGQSRGALYDPGQQQLHLKSQVEFRLSGAAADAASTTTTIRSGALRYLRAEGRIELENSVEILKQARRITAGRGTIWLDAENNVQRAELAGEVAAAERTATLAADASAGQATLEFAPGGRIRAINMEQNVLWSSRSLSERTLSARPQRDGEALQDGNSREGTSQRMALVFSETTGQLDQVLSSGQVRMTLRSDEAASRRARAGQMQVLSAEEAAMQLAPGGELLQSAQMRRSPKLEMHADAGSPPRTVTGDQFDLQFSPAGDLSEFAAQGHVRVVSTPEPRSTSRADARVSTSDELLASFDPATGRLHSLRQSGNFAYQDGARKARSATALYLPGEETILLERGPRAGPAEERSGGTRSESTSGAPPAITSADGRIAADWIRLFLTTGDLEARGSVATTSSQESAREGKRPAEPVHAVADHLRYTSAAQRARYEGRARLWQGTQFLLEAEAVEWNRRNSELTAQRKVLTIFRPEPVAANNAGAKNPDAYVIRADEVRYAQPAGRIKYKDGVRAQHGAGELNSEQLEIFLAPASSATAGNLEVAASRIERMTAAGNVKVTEKGRVGTGDLAEYFPLNQEVKLYGQPAVLTDPDRGATKGVQLTYQMGNNSASVSGEAGAQTETRWNVSQ